MPQFDLAGNPLPESSPAKSSASVPPPATRFDLAGNPLPAVPVSPPPVGAYSPPLGMGAPAYTPATGAATPYPARRTPAAAAEDRGKAGIWIGVGIATVAVLLIAVFLLSPKHGTVPTGWTTFTAQDHSFSCAAPGGWETTPSDKAQQMMGKDSTTGGVLFQSGSAQIDITTDTVATLVGYDVMHNNADPQTLTGSKAGVLHKQWKIATSAIHKGYKETQIHDFEAPIGDARLAEWTADGNVFGLGGRLHGYRAALVGGSLTAVVVCQCPEADWPALKPAFQHVIASVLPPAPPPDAPGAGVPGADLPAMTPASP